MDNTKDYIVCTIQKTDNENKQKEDNAEVFFYYNEKDKDKKVRIPQGILLLGYDRLLKEGDLKKSIEVEITNQGVYKLKKDYQTSVTYAAKLVKGFPNRKDNRSDGYLELYYKNKLLHDYGFDGKTTYDGLDYEEKAEFDRARELITDNDEPNVTGYQEEKTINNIIRQPGAVNEIYYGIPGCGKSTEVERKYNKDTNYIVEKIVFYPDYSYADFVGQYMPIQKENKQFFEFVPGPFSMVLKDALLNPTQKYAFVIEEINRGNAAAIFGDIFQLLDRNKDGQSEYSITNKQIYDYLVDKGCKKYLEKEEYDYI